MPAHQYSVAIIGAGPYGLALAAQLAAAGVDFILLGRPMGFWQQNVPLGTRLISGWVTCSFCDHTFDYGSYLAHSRAAAPAIFTAAQFIAYGLWFQRKACPDPDPRQVIYLDREQGCYRIRLDDDSEVTAGRVVIATGLKPFAVRPPQFAQIRNGSVSHTSDLHDLSRFGGKTVAVIGAGQSAMDCAALLSEQNARVEVVARANEVIWKGHDAASAPPAMPVWTWRGAIQDLRSDPQIYRLLPAYVRTRELERVLRPVAVRSLLPRVASVRFSLGRMVSKASLVQNGLELCLDDQTTRHVDHVVLATGYRVSVDAIGFVSPQLRSGIRTHDGYPELSHKMESSAPGLYFVGATAARSFGRLMWLVRGARWAAATISKDIVRRSAHTRAAAQTATAQL